MFAKLGSNSRRERPLRGVPPLVIAALFLMFTLSFSFATPQVALAATNLSSAGANLTHDRDCNSDPLGLVCLTAYPNGYNAEYINGTGQCFYADFTLYLADGRWVGSQGPFWTCHNQWNTYFFATGYMGCAQVVVYDRSHGQAPQSSSADGTFNTCDPN